MQLLGRADIQLMDMCDSHPTPPSILHAGVLLHMHKPGQNGTNIAPPQKTSEMHQKVGYNTHVFPTDPTPSPSHTGALVLCCAMSPNPMSLRSQGAQQGPPPHTPLCHGFPASCEVRGWGRSAYWCCSPPASIPAPAPV